MDKIKEQANIVSQLVFSSETGDIYKKMLTRTWDILREAGILIWLVVCLTFVGGEWFYRSSVGLGRNARTWYTSLSEKSSATEGQSMEATGEALLSTVKSSTHYLLSQARKQLGLPEPAPATPAAPVVAPPQPPVVEAPKPAPTPTLTSEASPIANLPDEDDL